MWIANTFLWLMLGFAPSMAQQMMDNGATLYVKAPNGWTIADGAFTPVAQSNTIPGMVANDRMVGGRGRR